MKVKIKKNFFCLISLLIVCGDSKTADRGNNYNDSKRDVYWTLEPMVVPKGYYVCIGTDFGNSGRYEIKKTALLEGLQYANMCESLAGIVNRAVENKESDYAIWLGENQNSKSYTLCIQDLLEQGIYKKTSSDGVTLLKSGIFSNLIKGYVLTDVVNNWESSTVAAVASHVYDAIIVDVRDKAVYDEMGLKMVYDATQKTTRDSWREFKDKCNNKALVLMPSLTNDMKDFAIANNLFFINIKNDEKANWDLLGDVLDWLDPGSPVYGWEDLDEHSFVQAVSEKGHLMVPCNFYMNLPLTSLNYSQKQKGLVANVINPGKINYSDDDENKYVSYYLSDGDNVQWIFHIWYDRWFKHSQAKELKIAYGIPSTNLDIIAPVVYKNIVANQDPENTLVENCGGGYIYIDAYASQKETQKYLNNLANKVTANMRQHRIKVLGLFTNDAQSENAKNGYKTFIEANKCLEGIIVVQYAPYNGGHGETYWYKNSDGIEIPVITVRYTLWNFGYNKEGQGTPAYVAKSLKDEQPDFSLIDIHAWSTFADIGNSDDLLGETLNGNIFGAGAAAMCQRRLPDNYKCISLQELIWRMRMKHNKEQTIKTMNIYK